MSENRRNIMVAIFVLAGLAGLSWMVFQFEDLPTWVSRYDARTVTIYFPEAPGIQINSSVQFRGYPVGRVITVKPPALLSDLDDPAKEYYQVKVVVAISTEYAIPKNAVPKIYQRGLGSSYLAFVLEDEHISPQLLADGDQIKGVISEASEFISEGTQQKLDQLIASLMGLSDNLQGQLTNLPPEMVDRADPNLVQPNVTTTVIRLDRALKSLNIILGDVENQRNIKQGLEDFSALSSEMRETVKHTQQFTTEAVKLVEQTSQTITNIDNLAGEFGSNFQMVAVKVQSSADALSQCLSRIERILGQVDSGEGTVGKILNDPKLYESLTDSSENFNQAITEFRELIDQWSKKGVKLK